MLETPALARWTAAFRPRPRLPPVITASLLFVVFVMPHEVARGTSLNNLVHFEWTVHRIRTMDRLLTLAVFARVAEMESFTGAARSLGLTKTSASGAVQKLEER